MKALIISLILFFLLLTGILLNAKFTIEVSEQLCAYSKQLDSQKSSEQTLKDLSAYWKQVSAILKWTVSKRTLARVEEAILSLQAAYTHNDHYAFAQSRALLVDVAHEFAEKDAIIVFLFSQDAKKGATSTN